ncbi:biotin synthase BioB, partial [Streptomyces sp. NPDC059538]
ALHVVNSIFLGDYLTSEGQAGQADLDMIADAGFEVEGAGTSTLPAHRSDVAAAATGGGCGSNGGASLCGSGASAEGDAPAAGCGSACGGCSGHAHADQTPVPVQAEAGEVRPELVAVRRRGAGTDIAPNA